MPDDVNSGTLTASEVSADPQAQHNLTAIKKQNIEDPKMIENEAISDKGVAVHTNGDPETATEMLDEDNDDEDDDEDDADVSSEVLMTNASQLSTALESGAALASDSAASSTNGDMVDDASVSELNADQLDSSDSSSTAAAPGEHNTPSSVGSKNTTTADVSDNTNPKEDINTVTASDETSAQNDSNVVNRSKSERSGKSTQNQSSEHTLLVQLPITKNGSNDTQKTGSSEGPSADPKAKASGETEHSSVATKTGKASGSTTLKVAGREQKRVKYSSVKDGCVVIQIALNGDSNVQFNFSDFIEKQRDNIEKQLDRKSDTERVDSESEAEGGHHQPQKSRGRKIADETYDRNDPFIDDEELFIEEGVVLSKEGFFVYSGPLIEEGAKVSLEKADGSGLRRSRAGKKNALTRGGALGGGYERIRSSHSNKRSSQRREDASKNDRKFRDSENLSPKRPSKRTDDGPRSAPPSPGLAKQQKKRIEETRSKSASSSDNQKADSAPSQSDQVSKSSNGSSLGPNSKFDRLKESSSMAPSTTEAATKSSVSKTEKSEASTLEEQKADDTSETRGLETPAPEKNNVNKHLAEQNTAEEIPSKEAPDQKGEQGKGSASSAKKSSRQQHLKLEVRENQKIPSEAESTTAQEQLKSKQKSHTDAPSLPKQKASKPRTSKKTSQTDQSRQISAQSLLHPLENKLAQPKLLSSEIPHSQQLQNLQSQQQQVRQDVSPPQYQEQQLSQPPSMLFGETSKTFPAIDDTYVIPVPVKDLPAISQKFAHAQSTAQTVEKPRTKRKYHRHVSSEEKNNGPAPSLPKAPAAKQRKRHPVEPPPAGEAPYGYKKDGTPRKIALPKPKAGKQPTPPMAENQHASVAASQEATAIGAALPVNAFVAPTTAPTSPVAPPSASFALTEGEQCLELQQQHKPSLEPAKQATLGPDTES